MDERAKATRARLLTQLLRGHEARVSELGNRIRQGSGDAEVRARLAEATEAARRTRTELEALTGQQGAA